MSTSPVWISDRSSARHNASVEPPFLIDPGGRVLASKFGAHAYDQWSVDELLAHACTAVRA
jgi:hypothetical protein